MICPHCGHEFDIPKHSETPASYGGLTDKQVAQANAKVDAIIENARHATYAHRNEIPETLLPLCDMYNKITGQEPRKAVLLGWIQSLGEMQAAGVTPDDLKNAKDAWSGLLIIRPGQIKEAAIAVMSNRRVKNTHDETKVIDTQTIIQNVTEYQKKAIPMPDSVRERLGKLTKKMEVERDRPTY